MATITAQMVKGLRTKTDLPMMECKQALAECDGDADAAMEWLRKKYKGKMLERAGRATGEGRIGVFIDDARRIGGLIELQCETASVGQNDMFIELADGIARHVAAGAEAEPSADAVRKASEVDSRFTATFGKLRETMNLVACRRISGEYLASYVHHDGKTGVLLSLDAVPNSDKNVGADLCMHAMFTQPVAITRKDMPGERVEKVRSEAIQLAKDEGKPEQIITKIAEGKVNAFFAQHVLMEQLHVKTDDYGKKKVGDCLKEAGVGGVTDLVVMKVGA